ncbi:MAG: glycosyl hydrolase family 8 [Chlorobiaceae bacterium]
MKTVFFLFLFIAVLPFFLINCSTVPQNPEEISLRSWSHFKRTFIRSGRVIRPTNNNDTVSEGEAYVMVRAVLMNDQETFNECLSWTEAVLSRKKSHGDSLLAWHFENGRVSDTAAASDADIDYAFSLILAYRTWHDKRYLQIAQEVLKSVLEHETAVINGRLYFLPWPTSKNETDELVALNPSYYAPSHFKLFYEVSADSRWIQLTDTTYDLLKRLLVSPGKLTEGGLVPDWIAVDKQGIIRTLPGKPVVYGWDAVRVPLRIAADYYIYDDPRALGILRWFSESFEKEFSRNFSIFSFNDSSNRSYENALFYSAAYAATEAAGSSIAPEILQRLRKCIRRDGDSFYYNSPDDYYINSLSWLPEYYLVNKTPTKDKSRQLDSERKHSFQRSGS